jgi:glucarate dehydratase
MTIAIAAVRVTPIAISDPPLLNAAGVHEPFGLRSIIEVEGVNGLVGLGETYGDAPVLDLLTRTHESLVGLSAFDLNGLWARVLAHAPQARTGHVEMELAPGSLGGNLVNSAFSAFEVAFLDLQARTLGIPLVELLGGAVRNKVAYSAYLFYKWDASVDPEYASDP